MNGAGARPELRRAVRLSGFFALAFGSMIGVGWVTALGSWLSGAGPGGTIAAFLAGGALMLLVGLCYAELTPMLPVAGGEVAYAYAASGTGRAFVVGWFLAFGYLSVSAFEAISVGRVLSYLVPAIDRWPLYAVGGEPVYGAHLLLGVGLDRAAHLDQLPRRQRGGFAANVADRDLCHIDADLRRRWVAAGRPGQCQAVAGFECGLFGVSGRAGDHSVLVRRL